MDKNKSSYITFVVLFCVIIAGFGGFYLGKEFIKSNKETIKNNTNNHKFINNKINSTTNIYKSNITLYNNFE